MEIDHEDAVMLRGNHLEIIQFCGDDSEFEVVTTRIKRLASKTPKAKGEFPRLPWVPSLLGLVC
jgi:hypothetical protein